MIEYIAGLATIGAATALAYGDLRAKIGKLEAKMDLIYTNVEIIMNNKKEE